MPKLGMEVIRRRQVIDAVVKILETQGWKELTIREVSEVAGVSSGIISHYFGNKRTMTIDSIAEAHHQFDKSLQEIERRRMAPTDRLLAAVQFAVGRADGAIPGPPFWLAICGRMPFDKLIQAEMRKLHQRYLEFLCGIVEAGLNQGVFKRPSGSSHEDLAEQFVGLAQGLSLAAVTDPSAMPPQRREALLIGMLQRELDVVLTAPPQKTIALHR